MDADGTGERLLFEGHDVSHIRVSSTGRHLAFLVSGGLYFSAKLYVASLADRRVRLVSEDSGMLFDWSSKGDRLLYTTSEGMMVWSAKLDNSEGLRSGGAARVFDAAWIPNSGDIVYFTGTAMWRYESASGKAKQIDAQVERLIRVFWALPETDR